LDPRLWRTPFDGVRLDPKDGDHAIERAQQAVETLEDLIDAKKSTVSDAALQAFVIRITAMERLLAVVAIGDAQAAHGSARDIQDALRKLSDGDARAARGQAHQAIADYKDAWQEAQDALKKW
jgi:hypothetical protein